MAQPIIRGIQAVGNVEILYRYNDPTGILRLPAGWSAGSVTEIITDPPIRLAGFRLDSEFLRATQQIASSAMIPILGGGGLALTNNNRSGTLAINCSRVSSPDLGNGMQMEGQNSSGAFGMGIREGQAYDMVLIAQCQQGSAGGDAYGATIEVIFDFNGRGTKLTFYGITVASVAPVALAGNDASNYSVELNYLDWKCDFYEEPQASGV